MKSPGNRIAIVTTVHPWGDPRVFEREASSALAWGLEVHVFMALKEMPERSGWSSNPRLHIHPLPQSSHRGGRMLQAMKVWLALQQAGPFGLTHFHDPELIPAMVLHQLLNPSTYVLYDIHEELPLEVESKPYLPSLIRRPLGTMAGWLWSLAKGVFSGFAPATEAIAEHWPMAQTRVVHNYPKALYAGGPVVDPDPNRILFVGALTEIRGIREVFAAMKTVRNHRPEVRLEIAGRIAEPSLEGLVSEAIAEGWCRHHSWLAPKALADFAKGAGIGLVPYLPTPDHLEALPTKIFEYMALGVPILASDFPLWRDLIQESGVGRVCPPQEGSLASTILEMVNQAEKLKQHAVAGRAAYRMSYRWEAEQAQMEWHYRRAGLWLEPE